MEGTAPYLPSGNVLACALRRVISIVLFGLAAASAAPVAGEPEYHLRSWTTEDGLPHNSVSRIVQDRAGFLWFATVGGLARFDGREFREIQIPPEHRPRGFNIRAFAEERPGVFVILPTSGNVLRYADGTWTAHPIVAAMAARQDSAVDLHVDPQGMLWVGLASGGLANWSSDKGARFFATKAGPVPRFRRFTFASDGLGKTWVSSDALFASEQASDLQPFEHAPREPTLIASGREGRIWVCTDARLQRLERGRLITESENVPWQGEFVGVRHLFEDSRGALWIASSRRGLLRYFGGRFTTVATPYPSISVVTEDREGNIWIGTDGRGVVQLREKSYRLYNTVSGLPHEVVSSIAEDSDGRIWLANRTGGLVVVDADGALQPGSAASFYSYANVVSLDARNRVWFGGGQSGLSRWDPGLKEIPVKLPLPQSNLHILFCAQNGDMWFASDPDGVGFYHNDQIKLLAEGEGLTPRSVSCITQDREGKIWIVDGNGDLFQWDGIHLARIPTPRESVPRPVHAIYADGGGRLWLGTAGGLVLKEGDQFHLLTHAHGLADEIVLQIVEDDEDRLWFAARRGLFYVAKSELLAAASGGSERVASHMFGRNQGLSGLTPTPNYQPAAHKARDGKLWFATTQGAVAIDPTRLPHDLPAPPVLIDEVRLDEHLLPAGALRVPSGQHRIEFRFAALSYTAPEDVLLRHQLEGADRQWTDTGSDRAASYTNLPAGDYRLRVIARNSAGRWNAAGVTLAFTVVPAWWETWAFRAGAILLLTALTAWLARTVAQRRLRERLQRVEQEHALEKERVRIARDLHDDLGASLTEVGLLADRLVDTPAADLAPQLASLAWRTRRLSTDLSGIVWSMSPRNGTLNRLGEFIRQYAQRLFRGLPIRCTVRGADGLPTLPLAPDFQHQLIAATKEALNNVLKHSRASEVTIELRYLEGCFEITIDDNGKGFTVVDATGTDGNGLRNIRARIEEIGGTVKIASAPAQGARILLRLPLSHSVSSPSRPE